MENFAENNLATKLTFTLPPALHVRILFAFLLCKYCNSDNKGTSKVILNNKTVIVV